MNRGDWVRLGYTFDGKHGNRDCEADLAQALDALVTTSPAPLLEPVMHLNRDKSVAVANGVFWEDDMSECPRGVKLLLLGKGGVAILGQYNGTDAFWVGWAPLPRRMPK